MFSCEFFSSSIILPLLSCVGQARYARDEEVDSFIFDFIAFNASFIYRCTASLGEDSEPFGVGYEYSISYMAERDDKRLINVLLEGTVMNSSGLSTCASGQIESVK